MHEYVQKSMSTTLPRRELPFNGDEVSHDATRVSSGMEPSSERVGCASAAGTRGIGADEVGCRALIRRDSALAVFTKENFVSRFVSHPNAIATTPMITAAPRPRRIHAS